VHPWLTCVCAKPGAQGLGIDQVSLVRLIHGALDRLCRQHGGKIDQRSRRAGHRNAPARRHVLRTDPRATAHPKLGSLQPAFPPDADVDQPPPLNPDLPKHCSTPVPQHCSVTAGEDGGKPTALPADLWAPDGVDQVQSAARQPVVDRPRAESELPQLSPCDDTVLALHQCPCAPAAFVPTRFEDRPHSGVVNPRRARFRPLNGLIQRSDPGRNRRAPVEAGAMLEVSRTLVKSEPELAELVDAVEGVEVTMAEKGFGTRVEVRAADDSGLVVADLERILDRLAEPQRQPFDSA
jgi:hypothetical protein